MILIIIGRCFSVLSIVVLMIADKPEWAIFLLLVLRFFLLDEEIYDR